MIVDVDTAYTDGSEERGLSRYYQPYSESREGDEELLKEIRERYKNWETVWKEHRKERDIDIRFICGDPWDPLDREARRSNGRPCISHDELGQYVNQCVNSVRMNKRGIKADPRGFGSSEKSALLRQDLIRTIEYDSNGPSIYASAYQQMVEGSYAFFRVSRRYITDQYIEEPQRAGDIDTRNRQIFEQEIVLKPILNPNSVLFDPDCKEPDWSDARACFCLEKIPREEFKRRWPKAQVTDFSWEDRRLADGWFFDENIIVAEYWRIEKKEMPVYLLDGDRVVTEARKGARKRTLEKRTVMQYITNGVEILYRSEEPEPGTILPIIPMIGLERYREDKRVLFSLVRLARDPQLSLAYLTSQEMEEAGLTPKSPWMGYKGQFDSNRQMWNTVTRVPYSFLETDIPDNWPAGQVPPLPQRVPFTPNFQSYEVAKDSCRRAIQAAMGITPLPTAMQRNTEKSGVALERIENLENIGSYHFVDGYDRALRLAGKVIDQWIPTVYSTERDLHVRKPDETYRLLKLNTAEPYPDAKNPNQLVHYPVEEVDHSIAVSTGPSFDSQRRANEDFLSNMIAQMPNLPVTPPQAAQLLSIAIKLKNMGPLGDQMAEIVFPTEGEAGQGMMQMQAAQAQLQQQGVQLQQLQAIVQQLSMEKHAKLVEGEYKMALEKLKSETDLLIERLKVDAQMAVAQIQSKNQIEAQRTAAISEANQQAAEQQAQEQKIEQEQEHALWLARQDYQKQLIEVQQAQQKAQPAPEQ
jgi:hypothetical protein